MSKRSSWKVKRAAITDFCLDRRALAMVHSSCFMFSHLLVQCCKIKQSRLTGTRKCCIILPLAKRLLGKPGLLHTSHYSAVQSCDQYERGDRSIALYRGRKCFQTLLPSPDSWEAYTELFSFFQIEDIELLSTARVKVPHRTYLIF